MTKHGRGTKSPIRKAGGLRRVLTAFVVLLLASALLVGAGSAAESNVVAKIGTTEYTSIADAISNAQDGDTVIILAGTHELNDPIEVKTSITIQGSGTLETILNNAVFDVHDSSTSHKMSAVFENLKFTGESQVKVGFHQKVDAEVHGLPITTLTVRNCDVVNTISTATPDYTNKGQFIYLKATYDTLLNLTVVGNTFVNAHSIANEDASPVIHGNGVVINKVEITGNTFGSVDNPCERYAVKLARRANNAEITISDNTVYGATTTEKDFYILDLWQSGSNKQDDLTVTVTGNTIHCTPDTDRAVYTAYIEASIKGESLKVSSSGNTVNNVLSKSTDCPVSNVITTHYFEALDGTYVLDTTKNTTIAVGTAGIQATGTALTDLPTGFIYNSNHADSVESGTIPSSNGLELKFYYDRKEFTITFETDGGNTIDPIKQDYESVVTKPANPTKEGYTFDGWDPEIPATMPAEDMEIKAQWKVNQYTITWKLADGSTVTSEAKYGTVPVYSDAVPTKAASEDGKYTYVFKGWTPELSTVTGNAEYTAVFETIEIPQTQDEPAPIQPVVQAQANINEVTGVTTITTTAGDKNPIVVKDEKTAEITDATGGVTITVSFEAGANLQTGEQTSISGKVEGVKAEYKENKAEAAAGAGEIQHQVTINLKNLTTELPQINPEFKQEVKANAAKHDSAFIPLAMLTAVQTGSTTLADINKELTGNKITLVFTVEKSVVDRYGKGNIRVMHLKGDQLEENLTPVSVTLNTAKTHYAITVHGNGFSNYVLGVKEEVQQSSGSSTPQGSSVWLTESQTPTQTPEQPTDKPTDSIPTDVPTTQPTPTQTETPGFGVLAVLAGLGAVAVLRRK